MENVRFKGKERKYLEINNKRDKEQKLLLTTDKDEKIMALERNEDNSIYIESYLVGYLYHALNDIAECLSSNDTSKALTKAHQDLKHIKDNLQFKSLKSIEDEKKTLIG